MSNGEMERAQQFRFENGAFIADFTDIVIDLLTYHH